MLFAFLGCHVYLFFHDSIANSSPTKKKKSQLREKFSLFVSEDDAPLPASRSSSMRSNFSEIGNSFAEERGPDGMRQLFWFQTHFLAWKLS